VNIAFWINPENRTDRVDASLAVFCAQEALMLRAEIVASGRNVGDGELAVEIGGDKPALVCDFSIGFRLAGLLVPCGQGGIVEASEFDPRVGYRGLRICACDCAGECLGGWRLLPCYLGSKEPETHDQKKAWMTLDDALSDS
jgi:hypothetical protein